MRDKIIRMTNDTPMIRRSLRRPRWFPPSRTLGCGRKHERSCIVETAQQAVFIPGALSRAESISRSPSLICWSSGAFGTLEATLRRRHSLAFSPAALYETCAGLRRSPVSGKRPRSLSTGRKCNRSRAASQNQERPPTRTPPRKRLACLVAGSGDDKIISQVRSARFARRWLLAPEVVNLSLAATLAPPLRRFDKNSQPRSK